MIESDGKFSGEFDISVPMLLVPISRCSLMTNHWWGRRILTQAKIQLEDEDVGQ